MIRSLHAWIVICGFWAAFASQASAQPQDEVAVFFENKIRPILSRRCLECHGSKKAEGGLRLDTETGFKKGGESGAIVDVDDRLKSPILQAIRYEGLEMPPKEKLPEDEIELLEAWVKHGAYWPKHAAPLVSSAGPREFSPEERGYWFYQPRKPIEVPPPAIGVKTTHPIDAFVLQRLSDQGLSLAPRADARTLARRAYLDLLGVPPTGEELQTFLNDASSDAYSKLVDRLLEDPRYGQRWGRYWLDLVRYAESDGYKQDDFRPTAYRYRDYVIRAFNEDKPYAQFVREQLAGDEIDRENPDVLDATGYLRLWIYEYNQRDVEGQWGAILNDLTDVTGEAFLGISIGCARCHDHKFDPLLQKDYYRLQAYFSGILPRDDVPLANAEEYAAYLKKLAEWEAETATLREAMAKLEQPVRDKTIANAIEKFPPPVRPALRKEDHQRTAREKQLAHLAFLQIKNEIKGLDFKKKLKDEALKEWESLSEQLAKHKEKKPQPFPNRLTIADVGVEAAEVCIPGAADEKIEPGILSLLQPQPMSIKALPQLNSSGRRLALAEWMVSPENPLTWRVIVNRVWQHHFGRGIVENTSDFGKLTSLPTHPELLDWLANWFVDHQGSFKQLHRLVMNSETYKQQSYPESATKYVQVDADNRYLWRFAARRLDAEQLRDSMLAVSGDIDYAGSGPSVEASSLRRSVFRKAMRNSPDAFLARFDAPDGSSSTAKRASTTTSVQALLLINSPWTIERAERLAKRVKEVGREPSEQITYLYREAFGRAPSDQEQKIGLDFLKDGKLEDFCHVVLSSNEFFFWE